VLWIFVEQRRTIGMLQGRARHYKNDTDFVERNKIKHRTGSFTNQRQQYKGTAKYCNHPLLAEDLSWRKTS
jgi:hypothetical protein